MSSCSDNGSSSDVLELSGDDSDLSSRPSPTSPVKKKASKTAKAKQKANGNQPQTQAGTEKASGRAVVPTLGRRPGPRSGGPSSGPAAASQSVLQTFELRKGTGNVKAPFKMPLRNYVPPPDKPIATIGPRRYQLSADILARITRTITVPTAGAATEELVYTPLCLYDPETDEDETRRTTYKKVWVEPAMAAKLRPHQREGVTFMFHRISGLAKGGYTGAVLMDGMGLGKTFQSICAMWTLLNTGVEGKATCQRALILCPSSLVVNWGNELKKWIGQDKVCPVAVDDTRGSVVIDTVNKVWSMPGGRYQGKPQVLIMSYTTFRMQKDLVYKKNIDLVMCDEAHVLKNPEAMINQAVAGLPAKRRLLLSGTPVQNDVMEFYALFNVAVPGLLGEKPQFKRRFEAPILRGQDADATELEQKISSERLLEMLQICSTYMLRRCPNTMKEYLPDKIEQVLFCRMSPLQTKLYQHFYNSAPVQFMLNGGHPGAAARQAAAAAAAASGGAAAAVSAAALPPISGASCGAAGAAVAGSTDVALPPVPAPTQGGKPSGKGGKASGKASGKAAGKRKAPPSGSACNHTATQDNNTAGPREPELTVLAAITAVRKLCCHPDLIYQMESKSVATPLTARQVMRLSGSAAAAATQQQGSTNPTQQTATETAQQDVITGFEGSLSVMQSWGPSPYVPNKCDPQHSGKVQVLVQLLKATREKYPTDKVVLVSNFTTSLDLLGTLCTEQRWVSLRLDGNLSVKKRQELVDTFNDPTHPSFLLLLSSKAGGVGLNIIGANRLILFDPDWNPANDSQAMARVWREGQKKRVFIYRLLTTGTLEENVYQRQLMKQGLSKSIVDDNVIKGQFSLDELKSLFKINANVLCDTHKAIKCVCDGQPKTMEAKAESLKTRAQEELAAQAEKGDANTVEEEANIMDWAHLADVSHSPDDVWKSIPVMARRNVSYVFSDHITTGNKKHAQQAAATKCDEGAECDGDTDMEGAAGDNSAGKKGSEGETYYEYE